MENNQDTPPSTEPPTHFHNPADISSQEVIGLQHYMDISSASTDHFNRVMEELQNDILAERDGNLHYLDKRLIEQAMLLDAVFRFYFAGGDARKPTPETLALAIKAQKQSAKSLNLVRMSRHRREKSLREEAHENSMSNARMTRNSEKIQKMAERKDRYGAGKHDPFKFND